MNKTVLTYGMYSFILASILFSAALYFGYALAFKTHGIVGYLTMLASLSFVYFGVMYAKNNDLEGEIEFKRAFVIGFGIASFAAIAFGLIDAIYITNIHPNFAQLYIDHEFTVLEAQKLTETELYLAQAAIIKHGEVFENSILIFFVTLMIMLVIGTIVSLLSALALYNKQEA
ncbi:MAG: DUF4199 domain-containing protein [Bacteroidota bacterium]